MLKKLDINSYMNGYNFGQMDCINIPIAAAAGFFNYDNYFYYCFYISVLLNWGNAENTDISEYANGVLEKLGIKMKTHEIVDKSDLVPFIKASIDNNYPILFIADYTSLFYTYAYLNDNASSHGTIISGYDSDKQIIALSETKTLDLQLHLETQKYFNGNPLFTMFLKEEQLLDIWENRNKHFEKSNKNLINILYSFEKYKEEAEVKSYERIISDFMNDFELKNDNLIGLVNAFNTIREKIESSEIPMWHFQHDLYGSLEAFFGGIENGLKAAGCKDELNDFYNFKEQYVSMKQKILSKLHTYALRKKDVSEDAKEALINEIREKNNELLNYLCYWHKIIKQALSLVNYALNSQATADSEYKKGAIHCKALQAVDGKWSNWRSNLWVSDDIDAMHWLKIDLINPQTITKLVVRHHDNKDYVTVDFEILGSNDDKNWDMLVSVQGNKKFVTEHEVDCSYRYFNLNIIKPGEIDYSARIFEFEAWGKKTETTEDLM